MASDAGDAIEVEVDTEVEAGDEDGGENVGDVGEHNHNDNADVGRTVEVALTGPKGLWPEIELVSTEADAPDWFDGYAATAIRTNGKTPVPGLTVVAEGTRIEFKSCARRIEDHPSTRRGRISIIRSNHERLLTDGGPDGDGPGQYVIAVTDPETYEVLRAAMTPATTVDALIGGEWWPAGENHHAEAVRQLPWTDFFEPEGVPDAAD